MKVTDSSGAWRFLVSGFLDKMGNPADDPGAAVFVSSDETVATVAADQSDTGGDAAIVTLTGKLGQTQISADYNGGSSNAANGGFSVVGTLDVGPDAAVSASGAFTQVTSTSTPAADGTAAAPSGGSTPGSDVPQ